MIKNIILLTKLSTRNFLEKYDLFKKNERKINKKSIYFWLILIVIVAMTFISNEILNQLQEVGQLSLFPGFLIAFMTIVMFMQTIILNVNVLYFSKDMNSFLPLAIKPVELLLSKVNTILAMLYGTEIIFMFIPLLLYGISSVASWGYYINFIFVMIVLPIFPVIVITILSLIFMSFIKVIKNKNSFQIITTVIFIVMIAVAEFLYIRGFMTDQGQFEMNIKNIIDNINKNIIVAEPLISILNQQDIGINLLKIIGIYSILYLALIIIGKKVYLKNILKATEYSKNKITKKVNFDTQCEPQNVYIAYLKNEFSNLFRNIIFFMQTIFPICMTIFSISFISLNVKFGLINKIPEIYNEVNNLHLNIEGICIILGIIQVLYSMVSISITAISRQGQNAVFMKYIPINLYKQFLIKNVPQITINIILAIIILILSKIIFPMISLLDLILIFIISIILSIINSFLMLIVDTKRPILNWKAEIDVFKQNGNKIFQYVWTIIVVVLLMYIKNIFKNLNIYIAILGTFIIFFIILFIINIYVTNQIKKNKLFKNII